jgi:hypothetical protein
VRSVSSLLILEGLMYFINDAVRRSDTPTHIRLEPYDVFELVAGSGTGG